MSDTPGPWIETVAWPDATGTLKEAYDWQAASMGEPAEFTRLGSLYPDIVMERLRLYKVVEAAPSGLTPLERRMAAFVTSTLNETPHCSSGLVHKLTDADAPPSVLDQVRSDPAAIASGDGRLDAIVRHATKLTRTPGQVTADDIAGLRSVGLDDLEILDLNNIVAYYNYINRVANGLGLHTEIPAQQALHAVPR